MYELTLGTEICANSKTDNEIIKNLIDNFNEIVVEHINPKTIQTIHNGVYTRTCKLEKNVLIVGAKIKIPTTLIINGHCRFNLNGQWVEIKGYNVIKANANRQQVFQAIEDTFITMIFKTDKKTFGECEKEFTDQWQELLTRSN